MNRALAYIRVNVTQSYRVDSRLDEQRAFLSRFAAAEGFDIAREYVDIERESNPPPLGGKIQLGRALTRARWLNIPIIVRRADALFHDAASLAFLVAQQVQFIVLGGEVSAEPFVIRPYRSEAKSDLTVHEASRRGNPKLASARKNATAVLKIKADAHALLVRPFIRDAQSSGCTSFRKIAEYLTDHGVKTMRGGGWTAKQVSNIMERLESGLEKYMDQDGRIFVLPRKPAVRRDVLKFLLEKFSPGTEYTENEVNSLLNKAHSFNDHAALRRELVEANLLKRTANCKTYWI